MEKQKTLYLPTDYAKLMGISPAAVTRKMAIGTVKVVIKNGRRYIEV